jgi:hypothetical protein
MRLEAKPLQWHLNKYALFVARIPGYKGRNRKRAHVVFYFDAGTTVTISYAQVLSGDFTEFLKLSRCAV